MTRKMGNQGFSLIELMVVVAIIGILSTIAIPQINKYMARARQSEAKTNLASIYTANKAFNAEFNIYDNRYDVIGYRPEGKLRYNTGWSGGTQCTLANYGYTTPVSNTSINAVTLCGSNGAFVNGCSVLADGNQGVTGDSLNCTTDFTAAAAGKITSSANIDRWTMTHQKNLTNTADGTN